LNRLECFTRFKPGYLLDDSPDRASLIRQPGENTDYIIAQFRTGQQRLPIQIPNVDERESCTAIGPSRDALTLREAAYPPVQYIPSEDVDFSQLERTDHVTYCPYKGDCNYYSVPAGGKKSVNAVWTYEDPFPAVVQIKGYIAFYPERVDEVAEQLPI